MGESVFSPDAQMIAQNYLARTGRQPRRPSTADILRPPWTNQPSPEGPLDWIQQPIDEAYKQGINFTPPPEQQVGGQDWLNAIAHVLTGAMLMRGAPPGSQARFGRGLLPGLGNDNWEIIAGFKEPRTDLLGMDKALQGEPNPLRQAARGFGLPGGQEPQGLLGKFHKKYYGMVPPERPPLSPQQDATLMDIKNSMSRLLKGNMPPKDADPKMIREFERGRNTWLSLEFDPLREQPWESLAGSRLQVKPHKGSRGTHPALSIKSQYWPKPGESSETSEKILRSLERRGLWP